MEGDEKVRKKVLQGFAEWRKVVAKGDSLFGSNQYQIVGLENCQA